MQTPTKRPKDMQRRMAYRAEDAAFDWTLPPDFPHMADLKAFVREVSAYLQEPSGVMSREGFMCRAHIEVRDGRGTRCARGGLSYLSFPAWSRRRWVILHEMAHHAVELENWYIVNRREPRPQHAAHGWRWAQCYLLLVRHFLGAAAHRTLRTQFDAHGVKYAPPRVRKARELTPEQKLVRELNLARAREVRAARRRNDACVRNPKTGALEAVDYKYGQGRAAKDPQLTYYTQAMAADD